MTPEWTKADEERVRGALKIIKGAVGSWQAIANRLTPADAPPEQRMARTVPHSWYARGRIPPAHVNALIALAPDTLSLKPADLCPEAKALEATPHV
ncbi:MAG TPA: hypothetical protein VFE72_02965 [Lysobacter sp.]|nr:hypothetical protein [Lysobacter sp.]